MRPTLLGSLLDAARHNVARNGPDIAIFESGTVYRAADGAASETRAARAPRARRAAERRACAPRSWRGAAARRPTSSPPRRCSRRCSRRCACDWSVRARARWPFLHPGRSAAVLAGGASAARLVLGELHPLVAGAWDLRAHGGVRDRPRQAGRASPRRWSPFAAFGSFPPLRQDLAVALPDAVAAAEALDARARGRRASCSRTCSVFDVYTRRAGGRGPALAGARAVLPRARAHAHRRGRRARCASASSRRSASSGVSCVAEPGLEQPHAPGAPRVLVAGATGFAGALAAHLLWRHPGFELVARHRALGGRPARCRSSTRATACR